MSKVLTKQDIANIANEIADTLERIGCAGDTRIYFNNRCIDFDSGTYDNEEALVPTYKRTIIEDINPLNYFEWAAHHHIISMSFEGFLYDYIYGFYQMPDEIEEILKRNGLYWELGNQWNLTMFPVSDDIEVEYTIYEKKDEPIYIFRGCHERMGKEYPKELDTVMDIWYNLGQLVGDQGCCVIGQKMCFDYKGVSYEMCPITGFQGEYSHTKWINTIKTLLKDLGATNICWNCGHLD